MAKYASAAALVALVLAWSAPSPAQDEPAKKDDALDRLLEKIEKSKPADKPEAAKPDPAKRDDAKPAEAKPKDPAKPGGEVDAKDKALDNLLEKLGQKEDTPVTANGPKSPELSPPTKPGEPKAGKLDGKSQDLDEHLEELLGRKKKKKDSQDQRGQGQGQGEGTGKLAEAIKKMREVEERLGKPDTGEDTRKKQGEIVQDLESILKQLRQGQGQGRGRIRMVRQAGNSNGQQPGQQNPQGNNANGVGPMRPSMPTGAHANLGDKNAWGNLPPELRTELENASSEEMLPSREELIRRYFLTVSKNKARAREE
jgi:hypothetical protein